MSDTGDLYAVIDATWPAYRLWREGGWIFRDGRGGGKRVSAATLIGTDATPDIGFAARTLAKVGQPPLFMLRPEQAEFDATLEAAGYRLLDPVTILIGDLDTLDSNLPTRLCVTSDDPTEDMAQVWAAGGIGPARLDIMRRCPLPKTCVGLTVDGDTVSVAYAAQSGNTVMCHAVEVRASHRRQGLGRDIMRAVLGWSRDQGAAKLAIITTDENAPALALYRGMGLQDAGRYHYRIMP